MNESMEKNTDCVAGYYRDPDGNHSCRALWVEVGRLSRLSGRSCHLCGSQRKVVHITGFYPGAFSQGFCGYYAKEQDSKLYVGFRFSAIFGFFESGVFDITIPVNGEINEVILKTRMSEISVWNAQTGLLTQSEQYGVYVKQERNDVYFVSMSYEGLSVILRF